MKLRKFTNGDWMGWGGATETPDGQFPMINDDEDYTVIVDADGVGVYYFADAGYDSPRSYFKMMHPTVGRRMVTSWTTIPDPDILEDAYGFEPM